MGRLLELTGDPRDSSFQRHRRLNIGLKRRYAAPSKACCRYTRHPATYTPGQLLTSDFFSSATRTVISLLFYNGSQILYLRFEFKDASYS